MADLVPGQDLSFEDALAQLEALVAKLEEGHLALADSVASYERGMGLAAYCTDLLDSAELRIRQIDTSMEAQEESSANGVFNLEDEIDILLAEDES